MSSFKKRFDDLCKKSIDEQKDFFLQRFVFALEDEHKTVMDLAEKFKECVKGDKGESSESELSPAAAAHFLQTIGKPRTQLERTKEVADVDVNNNGKISFIEFLLLTYKVMILKEYYKRKGEEPDVDLSGDGVGLVGVGDKLIEELFMPPQGLDPDLEKMMADFSLEHSKRQKQIEDLTAVVNAGGVKGMAAKSQLESLKQQDTSAMNALEAKISAAIKRATKKSAEARAALDAEEKNAENSKKADSKKRLAERAAKFGGGGGGESGESGESGTQDSAKSS